MTTVTERTSNTHTLFDMCLCAMRGWQLKMFKQPAECSKDRSRKLHALHEVGNPGSEIWAGIPELSWSSLSKVQRSPLNQYLLTLQHPLCLTLITLTCCTSCPAPSLISQLIEVSSCPASHTAHGTRFLFLFLFLFSVGRIHHCCVFVTR